MKDASACKDEISFITRKKFENLKHILSIELSSSVYLCFSCMDARHTLSSNKYFVGPLINKELTSEHKTLLENFINEQCNDDSSDSEISDEESEDSSEITSRDAIQVLKDMGIYDRIKLLSHASELNILSAVQRYVNIKFRELDVPEEDIPKLIFPKSGSGNIHQSHYDYYKRIAEILDEFDADGHDEFVNDKSNAGGTRDISSLSDEEVEYYRAQTLSEIQLDEDLEDLDDYYTDENFSKRVRVFKKVYVVFVVRHTSGKLIGYIFDDDINQRAKEPIAKYYNKNIEPFSPRATEEQKIIVDEIIRMLEGF